MIEGKKIVSSLTTGTGIVTTVTSDYNIVRYYDVSIYRFVVIHQSKESSSISEGR